MTWERVPCEGVREGGRGWADWVREGGRGMRRAADFAREVFRPAVFFSSFSADERESSCRAVSVQADFVTHVLPSVT